jgi:uncharacterized cupin superfamily protein
VPNVFGDDWDLEQSDRGFSWKRLRLGARLGAEKLGASLYELPPGQRSFPYHLHHANEELLIVLDGELTVRREAGEEVLRSGDTALFPSGPAGAHQAVNRSDRPARFLMVSTMIEPEILEYPDSGKVGLMAGAPPGKGGEGGLKAFLRRDAEIGYLEDEPTG